MRDVEDEAQECGLNEGFAWKVRNWKEDGSALLRGDLCDCKAGYAVR